jgi:glucoamylase
MPKSLILGNGNILVGLDEYAQVRDFYFPHVGLEEQVGKHLPHKIGIFVENKFSWIDDGNWEVNIDYQLETLASKIEAYNHVLKVKLEFCDVVYNETDIFLREVKLYNLDSAKRVIKVFFHQKFEISESYRADTAYFDPRYHDIVHYKGKRVFLVNAVCESKGFDEFSIGNFAIEGKEGTFKDAEDGSLSKNSIEHGLVDSVLGFTCDIEQEGFTTVYYWIAAGRDLKEAHDLNNYIFKKSPQHLIRTTIDFWRAWVNKEQFDFCNMDPALIQLFKKSLLITRIQVDNHGAIIASCDADMLKYGKDNYSYMWPRDGALVAESLDSVGDNNVAQRFFDFCNSVITEEGFFMHKYLADQSLASSWHPWLKDGHIQLPIQEDETAVVVTTLRHHFERSKDLEFVEKVYNSLIKAAADFMVSFRDINTGLPKPSYDLWEEKQGVHTFTAAAVYGALVAAAEFAEMLGKDENAKQYRQAAEEIKAGVLKYLYDVGGGYFYKSLTIHEDGSMEFDKTVDISSAYGIFKFHMLEVDDERLTKAMELAKEKTAVKNGIGGYTRYENDYYYRVSREVPGNPWFITTCWVAQYAIARAQNVDELKPVVDAMEWVLKYSNKAGILGEQLNPYTGEPLSAAPLAWSSAEFIRTVLKYLEKLEKLGVCPAYRLPKS